MIVQFDCQSSARAKLLHLKLVWSVVCDRASRGQVVNRGPLREMVLGLTGIDLGSRTPAADQKWVKAGLLDGSSEQVILGMS